MLALYTDTDCDVTPFNLTEYNYKLISMPYSLDGETCVYPYADGKEIDFHAFYDELRNGLLPTTSAVGKETYISAFEAEFAAGNDVLYVHFSRAMSASFGNMDAAVAELREKYPERKFYAVDTKGITTISYAITAEVGKMIKEGKTPEEVVEWSKAGADTFAMYFFADDLKFFRRSGRVSGLAAMMGTLVGIRPIIYMSPEGKMVSCGKERGRYKAVDKIISMLDEIGDHPEDHPIYIGHTDADDIVEEVCSMIRAKYPEKTLEIRVIPCNPTSGAHAGPDGVGICFRSKSR
ncbi:MAG: DegV family protein [Clostridia bacterium]|nr:DegV family protein [Clostridia bacterium]